MSANKSERGGARPPDVQSYLADLDPARRKLVQAIRKIILGVDPGIHEEIKWNAPSYALSEHFVTFNAWARDYVQLIFHHGPKKGSQKRRPVDDPDGFLEWLAPDRASMRFDGMKDVQNKKAGLQSIARQWIKAMGAGSKAAAKPPRRSSSA